MNEFAWILIFSLFGFFLVYALIDTIKTKLKSRKQKKTKPVKIKQTVEVKPKITKSDNDILEEENTSLLKRRNELYDEINELNAKVSGVSSKLYQQKQEYSHIEEILSANITEKLVRYIEDGKRKTTEEFNRYLAELYNDGDSEVGEVQTTIDKKKNELLLVEAEIDEWQTKRDAINAAIKRDIEKKEKEDLYRLKIPALEENDIEFLLSIEQKLSKSTTLRKLIWTEYIKNYADAMMKKQFNGKIPKNVIYMIKNETNQMVYIGKTKREINLRWNEHLKSSLGIGIISGAEIHNALFKHWNDFSFQVLEIVSTSQSLEEREKFYIDFYGAKDYGYNKKEVAKR